MIHTQVLKRVVTGGSDRLTLAEMQQPVIVSCGVCKENINAEDATYMPIPNSRGWAYCCRECLGSWEQMAQYIKPTNQKYAA